MSGPRPAWGMWKPGLIPLHDQDEPMDTDQSSTFLSSIQSEIAKYQLLIEEENQKLKRYKVGFCRVVVLAHLCPPPRLCPPAGRKHSAEAQLPSFHHGAAEDAGGASAADAVGGEGLYTHTHASCPRPRLISSSFSSGVCFPTRRRRNKVPKKLRRPSEAAASCSHTFPSLSRHRSSTPSVVFL